MIHRIVFLGYVVDSNDCNVYGDYYLYKIKGY